MDCADSLLMPAEDSVKILKVVMFDTGSGQVSIENCAGRFNSEFDRYYVHLSGYCGDVNPHTFAAAPELLRALECLLDDGHSYESEGLARAFARAAIAKARGEA